MEQYILQKLDMELNGEDYLEFIRAVMLRAKDTKKVGNTIYFTYPLDTSAKEKIEFVAEGSVDGREVMLKDFYIHHANSDVLQAAVCKAQDKMYVLKKGGKEILVTLVNEKMLSSKEEENLEVSAFGHSLDIFHTEEEYLEDVRKCGAVEIQNGAILPLVYLNRKLDNEELAGIDKVVTLRGQIVKLREAPLNVFGIDVGSYYIASVATSFGNIPVFFKGNSIENKNLKSIREGDILVGNVSITCKVKGE